MRLLTSPHKNISLRQLSMAAQNLAAAQFVLYGFDVLEQAGRTKFLYDLSVANAEGMMKVAVHGSFDGFWNLVDRYVDNTLHFHATRGDYHRAIDLWLDHHSSRVTCCLVQFESVDLKGMPRIYLASSTEVAEKLHENTERLGDSALYEEYEITNSSGAHRIESLPPNWQFSSARITQLMDPPQGKAPLSYRFSTATRCVACSAEQPAACVNCLPMMN